ncbi:MAG: hypothetical protein F4Y94_04105, partial [Chloroflexi bacterium]|nr:hypothetical protein [Chloroflexota bacterium]
MTLILSSALASTDTGVTVSYTKPTTGSNNRLASAGGVEVGTFDDLAVSLDPPVFDPIVVTRTVAENTAAGMDIGDPVTAGDDTFTYTLGGPHADSFALVWTSGQLQTRAGVTYDHEARERYVVTVTASDGTATASATVMIEIIDLDEPPPAPAAPSVDALAGSDVSLYVNWRAPANPGRPPITGYDLQYRRGTSGSWTDGPQGETSRAATISGLVANSLYQVRVRAKNAEGDSAWSDAVSGITSNEGPGASQAGVTPPPGDTTGVPGGGGGGLAVGG